MCGLIAQMKNKSDGIPTHETIKGMLLSQIHRGTEGFGYISFNDCIESYVRRENRYEIERAMDKNTARSMIFHHRIPTSTPNFADCTHPIKVSHDELKHDYYLIHNGMISNDSILYNKHIQLGYEYTTTVISTITTKNDTKERIQYNDSEALAIDVARFLEKKQTSITARGSIAFICAQTDKVTGKVLKVFFGRNSSPLTINVTENSVVLRSEGETEMCEQNHLYVLDMKSFKVSKSYCPIGELISVRNDISQGYGNHGWDNEDRYSMRDYSDSIISSSLNISRGRNATKTLLLPQNVGETEVIASDIELAEQFSNNEITKIETLIEDLECELAMLQEDLEALKKQPNVEVQIMETERQIKEVEDDIDKFEAEIEALLSEDLEDMIYSQ